MKLIRLIVAVVAAGLLMSTPSSISIAQQGDQKETPVLVGTTMLTPDQLKAALDKMRTDLDGEKGKSAYLEKKLEDAAAALEAEKGKTADLEKVRKELEREAKAGDALRVCYTQSDIETCLLKVLTEHAGTQSALFASTEMDRIIRGFKLKPNELVINRQRTTPPMITAANRDQYDYGFSETHRGMPNTQVVDCRPEVKLPTAGVAPKRVAQQARQQPVQKSCSQQQ